MYVRRSVFIDVKEEVHRDNGRLQANWIKMTHSPNVALISFPFLSLLVLMAYS